MESAKLDFGFSIALYFDPWAILERYLASSMQHGRRALKNQAFQRAVTRPESRSICKARSDRTMRE